MHTKSSQSTRVKRLYILRLSAINQYWMGRVNICFMLSIVPVDWVIACMVPLCKCKGDVHECSNFRGISLLSVVGKVYDKILINRIRDKTENVKCRSAEWF